MEKFVKITYKCTFSLQLVFVSVGVGGRGAWAEWPSAQPAPARARLPTLLLLDPTYFHQLFTLMQALGQMKEPGANSVCDIIFIVFMCCSKIQIFLLSQNFSSLVFFYALFNCASIVQIE